MAKNLVGGRAHDAHFDTKTRWATHADTTTGTAVAAQTADAAMDVADVHHRARCARKLLLFTATSSTQEWRRVGDVSPWAMLLLYDQECKAGCHDGHGTAI